MIPSIEQIVWDLLAGSITREQAIAWLQQHAEGDVNERRDYFAANVLTECMRVAADQTPGDKPLLSELMNKAALYAYAAADAMLKVRNQPQGESHK